jgi:predicted Zn finger-like uncharacterized protein
VILLKNDGYQRVMPEPHPIFNCPNCNALYYVAKAEVRSEIVDRWVTCRTCKGPLPACEGKFILKYLLLRKAVRRNTRPTGKVTGS